MSTDMKVQWTEKMVVEKLKFPLFFDKDGGFIFDKSMKLVLELRGWGWMQYLPNGEELQDLLGQMIVDAVNAFWMRGVEIKGMVESLTYSPQERTDLFLNRNSWSKNDVRLLIRDCETLEKEIAKRDSHGPEGQNVTNAQHLALRTRCEALQNAWNMVKDQLERDCELGQQHKSKRALFLMQEHPECDGDSSRMAYLVLETFGGPDHYQLVADEDGVPILWTSHSEAMQALSECQGGVLLPIVN